MNGTNCQMIVNASSVNMFKNRIDRYLIRVGYTQIVKFDPCLVVVGRVRKSRFSQSSKLARRIHSRLE